MNIALLIPAGREQWFENIRALFAYSLQDLGHTLTNAPAAEIIIGVQQWPLWLSKTAGRKRVLIQTEQTNSPLLPPGGTRALYGHADAVWGFDIHAKDETYIYLGWHPCLEVAMETQYQRDIGLLGTVTHHRCAFLQDKLHKPHLLHTFDKHQRVKLCKESRVNLNIHAYGETGYTEWDRLSFLMANRCFILSERLHCPIAIPQCTQADYDSMVSMALADPIAREQQTNATYQTYRNRFDHREQLERLLKAL